MATFFALLSVYRPTTKLRTRVRETLRTCPKWKWAEIRCAKVKRKPFIDSAAHLVLKERELCSCVCWCSSLLLFPPSAGLPDEPVYGQILRNWPFWKAKCYKLLNLVSFQKSGHFLAIFEEAQIIWPISGYFQEHFRILLNFSSKFGQFWLFQTLKNWPLIYV